MAFLKKIPLAFYILAAYTILSGWFAFERILNTDNSYYLFNILNAEGFWFAENRVGVAFTQVPLLLFSHFGAPMTWLIYTYSLTFPLVYVVLALLSEYYLRVKEATLTLSLVLITGVAYSFFHPATETYQALGFATFLYAVLVSDRFKQISLLYYAAVLFVSLLCITSHPIGVFLISFVVLLALMTRQVRKPIVFFVLALAAVTVVLRLLNTNAHSYDTQQYANLFETLSTFSGQPLPYPLLFLQTRLPYVYPSTIVLLLAFVLLALREQKLLLFSATMLCSLGLAAIGVLTFARGDADMMMEKTFLPSIFMLLLPFGYMATHATRVPRLVLSAVVLLMAFFSFKSIFWASEVVVKRLAVLETIARQATWPKLIAEIDDFQEPALQYNPWNTVVDSYIIAQCKAQTSFTLFITPDKNNFTFDSTDTHVFLGPPWAPYWKKNPTNKHYFNLPPVGYRLYQPDSTRNSE